jgi:hypothetical protein
LIAGRHRHRTVVDSNSGCAVLVHRQVILDVASPDASNGRVHCESAARATWRNLVAPPPPQLFQPQNLRANAGQGMQCTNPNQAVTTQLQIALVGERQFGSTGATRTEGRAGTNFCRVVGRHPILIGRPLNLDPTADHSQRGRPDRWNLTPDVGAAQSNDRKRQQGYRPHDRPGVHQEGSETIPTGNRFHLMMGEELRGPVKHPGGRCWGHVCSCGVQDTLQTFQVLLALWTAFSQMRGDLLARDGVRHTQREVYKLIESDCVIGHRRMVTQSPTPPECPARPRCIGTARRSRELQGC